MPPPATLGQVAINVFDVSVRDWYARVFGFVYAGATDLFFGPTATRVQGIERVAERCKWLIDSKADFQIEFFKFLSPRSKPRRPDWRLADVGYAMMGVHVRDFDGVISRLTIEGTPPLTAPVGARGARRVCARDPEGNLLELHERDPLDSLDRDAQPLRRPDVASTVRVLTISVPHLENFARTLTSVFDLEELPGFTLHGAEDEALWGLEGAVRESVVLRAGGALIELVQYRNPAARPWPVGYRICDQGFMNMAFVFDSAAEFDRRFERAVAAGLRPNGAPLDAGVFKVMYVNDPCGFSIELLHPRAFAHRLTGFLPSIPYIEEEVVVDAPPARVWALVCDQERMSEWTDFEVALLRPGRDERNGVGALRRLKTFGASVEEEIVEYLPERLYSYRLLRGAPIRHHRGTVMLLPQGAGTRVRWAVAFESVVPGTGAVLAAVLRRAFRSSLAKLKARLEA